MQYLIKSSSKSENKSVSKTSKMRKHESCFGRKSVSSFSSE